jgi:hypothetical protein
MFLSYFPMIYTVDDREQLRARVLRTSIASHNR